MISYSVRDIGFPPCEAMWNLDTFLWRLHRIRVPKELHRFELEMYFWKLTLHFGSELYETLPLKEYVLIILLILWTYPITQERT
jgi:hypothetical protein